MLAAGFIMSNGLGSLSLQKKVSASLLAVMLAFGLLSYLSLNASITPAFEDLESKAAQTNLVRALRVILADLEQLNASNGDWAPWDDAYNYALGKNPKFIEINADIPTLVNLDLNLMLIYDLDGHLLWGQLVEHGEGADLARLGAFEEGTPQTKRLISHPMIESVISGLIRTKMGPLLISSMPILQTGEMGPVGGTIVMARFLDDSRIWRLSEQTEIEFAAYEVNDPNVDMSRPLAALGGDDGVNFYHETTDDAVLSYGLMRDVFGDPLIVLEAKTNRELSALGGQTVNGTLLFLSLAAVFVALVVWLLLRRVIVGPLEMLAKHIVGIRESGDLSKQLKQSRSDEIGKLADEFDKMTTEVQKARQLLLDQSFKAGKADTAAEVLHNIRNAMTPLFNGLERLAVSFDVTSGLRIKDAVEQLTDPDCPADRQAKLLQYINASFDHIESVGRNAGEDLNIASKQAGQVQAILADQERHANVAPVFEVLDLDDVVDEAANVIPESEEADLRVNFEAEVGEIQVRAHRVGLLQVMGNLILNAYESIQRSQSESGEISVVASAETVDKQDMVRLTIRDSGCGFDDNIRQKIFQRGYTSKPGHMTGLGLHWCANALAGMGGRIQAESTGFGHGAEFHVLLPSAHGG
jgi:two-component system, NtrC family, sensor kinase